MQIAEAANLNIYIYKKIYVFILLQLNTDVLGERDVDYFQCCVGRTTE